MDSAPLNSILILLLLFTLSYFVPISLKDTIKHCEKIRGNGLDPSYFHYIRYFIDKHGKLFYNLWRIADWDISVHFRAKQTKMSQYLNLNTKKKESTGAIKLTTFFWDQENNTGIRTRISMCIMRKLQRKLTLLWNSKSPSDIVSTSSSSGTSKPTFRPSLDLFWWQWWQKTQQIH